MTYNHVADMQESVTLKRRIIAAVAKESILDPEAWVYPRHWQIVSQPGWDSAWASAVAGGVPDPGGDEGVITDGMILSGVQAVIQSELPPPPPIIVVPGSVQEVASTDPLVRAEPQTLWAEEEFATFTDGAYRWAAGAWVLHVIIDPTEEA